MSMSVSCGLTDYQEAWQAAMDSEEQLEDLATEYKPENNPESAALYLEARRKLEELKIQLKDPNKKDDFHIENSNNDLKLLGGITKYSKRLFSLIKNISRRKRDSIFHRLHPEGFRLAEVHPDPSRASLQLLWKSSSQSDQSSQ